MQRTGREFESHTTAEPELSEPRRRPVGRDETSELQTCSLGAGVRREGAEAIAQHPGSGGADGRQEQAGGGGAAQAAASGQAGAGREDCLPGSEQGQRDNTEAAAGAARHQDPPAPEEHGDDGAGESHRGERPRREAAVRRAGDRAEGERQR